MFWDNPFIVMLDASERPQTSAFQNAQFEIDLVKLEAKMIAEGDLDEETERLEKPHAI